MATSPLLMRPTTSAQPNVVARLGNTSSGSFLASTTPASTERPLSPGRWGSSAPGSTPKTSAESPEGHHAASRAEARYSLNRRHEMPGGLPDRDSFDSLADPYVVVAQKALGGHDTQLQL